MIRFASVLFAALFAINAQATPKLGDYAAFDLTASLDGQTMQGTMEQEIVQANADQFLERQTITFSGQAPEVTDSWRAVSDFLDDDTITAILQNCASAGGVDQTISVPAGTYNTCALNFDNEDSKGMVWVTMVPFGVARVDTLIKANNVHVTTALRTFR